MRHPGPERSARPSAETLSGIGAILSLVLATTVYAVGPTDVPSGAAFSALPPAVARTGTSAAPVGPTTVAVQPAVSTAAPEPPTSTIGPGLDARLNGIIRTYSGYQLGVALIDLSDGAVHEYGARGKFTAASTGKILAAAAYYRLAETGELSLTEPMGTSTAGLQIRQMIQQSDNDSWALILAAIGDQRLADYADSIGITYDRSYNTLTPAEMARTLSLLYSGQLLSAPHTAELLSYMQNTNLETLIPAALPPDVVVFHKYGLLYGNLHDASILVRGGKAYVFVVYTLGRSPAEMTSRTRVIHLLTRAVTAELFPG